MPEHDADRLELANQVRSSLALENQLSAVQARSYVRCLQATWQVPPIIWREGESRSQFGDARRLIQTAELFRNLEGKSSSSATDCYRRAGELLEWLTRSEDAIAAIAPIELYAASAYQLGGLPAMASGLLRQVENRDDGSLLLSHFLRADFDAVLKTSAKFWLDHPELTHSGASQRILSEDSEDSLSWYITVEIVRSMGLIADALRRGKDERLDKALKKLGGLDKLANRMSSDTISLLISLLHSVALSFKDASIYEPVLRLAAARPEQSVRLQAFARTQFGQGRGILWTSQQHGLERLLNESSFALCTPTGSGKTLVANLALVKELLVAGDDELAPLAMYLVPSRALAGEVEAKLRTELGGDFIITGLYGGADWGITDYWLKADRPTVLIATVEKAEALMRYLGPLLHARLKLLIVDEAHQVVADDTDNTRDSFADHNNRSLRLEGFVSRLLTQKPNIVRIALTAVAGSAAFPVARWIESNDDAEAVGVKYRSTRQVTGKFEVTPLRAGRMLLDIMNDQPLYVRDRDEPVYLRLQTPPMPQLPATLRNSIYHFNELNVLWTALHLTEGNRRILISVMQSPEKTMRWYAEAFELTEWSDIEPFEIPDDNFVQDRFEETREACIDYCGPDSYELALLECGIATNHGQMPQRLRRLMTDLIDRGICPITVATSTLTEGVNLPFDLIFLTSLKRTVFKPGPPPRQVPIPLTTSEFRNLSGRAGRPGAAKGMEGMTLIAVPQRPSSTAKGTKPLQRRQIKQMQAEYDDLRDKLLVEHTHDDWAESPLSLLLKAIAESAQTVLGISEGQDLLDWLEAAIPSEISEQAGQGNLTAEARLADSVDELDGFLLSALEELSLIESKDLQGADAEVFLKKLWQRTFANMAAIQEDWLEQAFVQRGRSIVETVYPDPRERERLYQYGFTPYVGRRFETTAPLIKAQLEASSEYGAWDSEARLEAFSNLGGLLVQERGYGFRIRDTETDREILQNWQDVLAWWMNHPDAQSPEPAKLRSWQRFVADNLEFRLGVTVGAVVAQAWSANIENTMEVPSLDTWQETTGLPWFGFWAKELLRWGTLDPFVAFTMAQGMARTRERGSALRSQFEAWLQDEVVEISAEDLIDPQQFLAWQRFLPPQSAAKAPEEPSEVELTGTRGQLGRYNVIPVLGDEGINWVDASGYSLCRSNQRQASINERSFHNDYDLVVDGDEIGVHRVFTRR